MALRARVEVAYLKEDAGDVAGALEELRVIIEALPGEGLPYASRARLLMDQERWAEALVDLNTSLSLRPSHDGTLYMRGQCLMQLDDFDGAMRDFERCVEISPFNAWAHLELGIIHECMGDPRAALARFRFVQQIDPDLIPDLNEHIASNEKSLAQSTRHGDSS